MKHGKQYNKVPNDMAKAWSDTEVPMRDKLASSGVLQGGFQNEI